MLSRILASTQPHGVRHWQSPHCFIMGCPQRRRTHLRLLANLLVRAQLSWQTRACVPALLADASNDPRCSAEGAKCAAKRTVVHTRCITTGSNGP